MTEAAADERVRWGVGDALLGTVVTVVVPAVIGIAVLVATGRSSLDGVPLWQLALLQVPLWAGLLGAPLWATHLKGRGSLAVDFGLVVRWRGDGASRLRRFARSDPVVGVVVGIGGQIALIVLVAVIYSILGIDTSRVGESAEELTEEARSTVGVVLLILIVGLAAPVLEELFYRGLWLRALARRFSTRTAVIGSSAVFALIHFQPYDLPALFGFGVIAAVLTVRTGRLGAAVWAHVAFNMAAVLSLLAT